MKFYKENNINPAASCLPLLAQFPVFISLYLVLKHFPKHPPGDNLDWLGLVEHHRQGDRAGWSGCVLVAIYALSQLASSYFMCATMEKSQRIMLLVLPIVFIPFIINFPVGLVLYWVTTNLWTVGQGLVTRRLMPRPAAPEKRSSRTPPKEVATAAATAPEPADRAGRSRRSRARSSARRAGARDDRDESCRSRRRARPSARRSGPRCASSSSFARDRQGGGPLPGRLRGRARAARRRLRAGAGGRVGRRGRGGRGARARRRSTRATRPREVRERGRAHPRRRSASARRIEIDEDEERDRPRRCVGRELGAPDRQARADDRRDPVPRERDRLARPRRRAQGGGRGRGRLPGSARGGARLRSPTAAPSGRSARRARSSSSR